MKATKKRYLFVLLVSYLVLLAVPLVMGGITHNITRNAVEQEVFRANSAILQQAAGLIDRQIEQKKHVVSAIALDANVERFLRINQPLGGNDRYLMLELSKTLSALQATYPFLSELYLYSASSDLILSPGAVFTPQQYYEYRSSWHELSYSEWHDQILCTVRRSEYIPMVTTQASQSARALGYITSLPLSNRTYYGNLVMLLPENEITAAFGDHEWLQNGLFYIVDNDLNIIYSSEPEPVLLENLPPLARGAGFFTVHTQEGDMALSYVSSQQEDWRYISLMPTHIYMEPVDYVRKVTFVVLLVTALLGILLAGFLTWRNYFPIRRIMRSLVWDTERKGEDGGNEFDLIQSVVQRTRAEDERIIMMLEEQRPLIRNNLLLRLIKGDASLNEGVRASLAQVGVSCPHAAWCVAIMDLGTQRSIDEDFEEHWPFFYMMIQKALPEKALWSRMHGVCVEVSSGKLALLFHFSGEEESVSDPVMEEVTAYLEGLVRDIMKELEISCSISVGAIHIGNDAISHSYAQASHVLASSLYGETPGVVRYQDILPGDQSYYYPLEMEQQIVMAVKAADRERTAETLSYLFKENFSQRCLSADMGILLYHDLIGTMIKLIGEIGERYEVIFDLPAPAPLWGDPPADNAAICHRLHTLYGTLCDYLKLHKGTRHMALREGILSYCAERYRNPDICLQMIAAHFHITAPYLSRFFKEQTGDNLNRHINMLRVERAKELLLESGAPVGRIAEQVGYASDAAFIRVFKKTTGITPGLYRQQSQIQEGKKE